MSSFCDLHIIITIIIVIIVQISNSYSAEVHTQLVLQTDYNNKPASFSGNLQSIFR